MSIHGKDTAFLLEDSAGSTLRNISVYLDSVEFNQENDTHDNTTFGAEGHTFAGGLTNGTISLTGLWDDTASTGSHTVLQSLIGHEVPVGFEYGPEGNGAGAVKLSGDCLLESYSESSPVADLVKFNATLRISGVVTAGTFSA